MAVCVEMYVSYTDEMSGVKANWPSVRSEDQGTWVRIPPSASRMPAFPVLTREDGIQTVLICLPSW